MTELLKPYIVSADVNGLLERWLPTRGLSMPTSGLVDSLQEDLRVMMQSRLRCDVIVIGEQVLREGLIKLAVASEFPIISLDRAYLDGESDPKNVIGHIDMTRPVDENFDPLPMQPRPGYPSEDQQLNEFKKYAALPVTLLDDVLFHGTSFMNTYKRLGERNISVKKLIAGISIASGRHTLEEHGIEVISLIEYDDVWDEVCERDFRAGVSMSGRTVYSSNGEVYSAPYIYPFGDPEKWATIPKEHIKDLSRCCLEQSIELWRNIERASGRKIPTGEVPRQIRGVSQRESIVYALEAFK